MKQDVALYLQKRIIYTIPKKPHAEKCKYCHTISLLYPTKILTRILHPKSRIEEELDEDQLDELQEKHMKPDR